MDAAGHSQHTIKLDSERYEYFTMAWSGDSQFLLTQFPLRRSRALTLYHIPDLKKIDLGNIANMQIGDCFENCWKGGATGHRLAYAAPTPGQPSAASLVLLDAAASTLKSIPIPQMGQPMVRIDPNGSYVAVAQEANVTFDSDNSTTTSVPLWVYRFDS